MEEPECRMATSARESATRHNGKLLLRFLSKKDVCDRLAKRFPTIAQAIDMASLASSPVSVDIVQSEFWDVMHREICIRDNSFLLELVGANFYEFSRKLSQHYHWYRAKVSPLLLLRDVVFFSDVSNPAFPPNSCLEPLLPPLEHVYVHTMDLSAAAANPKMLIEAAGLCSDEALVEAVRLKDSLPVGEEYSLFWHGTASVAAKGIICDKLLRQSGTTAGDAYDFGRGVYFFSNELHALSFALDRTFIQIDSFNKRANPALLCMCIPKRLVVGVDYVDVNNFGGLTNSGSIQDLSELELELEMLKPFDEADRYRVGDLDGWGQFVKYCLRFTDRPTAFGASHDNIFHGWLHECLNVGETKKCARPKRDPDGWRQWCFSSRNLLTQKGYKFFFFELNHPDLFKDVSQEEYDNTIVAAAASRD